MTVPCEERNPMNQLVQYYPQSPNIYSFSVLVLPDLLGGYVLLSACYGLHQHLVRRQPEVGQFYLKLLIVLELLDKKYVLWFQISVTDPVIVEDLHCLRRLQYDLYCLGLSESFALDKVQSVPKRASLTVFCEIAYELFVLENLKHFEDVGVVDFHKLLVDLFLLLYLLWCLLTLLELPQSLVGVIPFVVDLEHFSKSPNPDLLFSRKVEEALQLRQEPRLLVPPLHNGISKFKQSKHLGEN